jgi:Gluconate 2-dehydrogenase subunit 3
MKRRELIKGLGASALMFPLTAWSKEIFGQQSYLDNQSKAVLDLISSTFIPEGKQKGAKGVGVVLYLDRYVQDCLNKNEQEKVQLGIDFLKNQGFALKNQMEREQMLLNLKASDSQQWFYDFVRSQTILAYTNSEYVLTNFYGYEMAPGYFKGCVNV